MSLSNTRRALILANVFNSLVAIYFIIIAIVGLVQLRWYHQLTVSVKTRHLATLTTSYFAFFILILVGLLLLGLFVSASLKLSSANHTPPGASAPQSRDVPAQYYDQHKSSRAPETPPAAAGQQQESGFQGGKGEPRAQVSPSHQPVESAASSERANEDASTTGPRVHHQDGRPARRALVLRELSLSDETNSSVCCSILLYLLATIGLIVSLLIWLFNTGELVRDSISTQLDYALARYQFSNRSNPYSVAIDGLQDVNNCCGSLDYSDFPHQRIQGLSSGHYPGSCCGKNIFGVNARVLCTADEIWRAKQTAGCTTVLANHYDLISLLIVPVALVCLFVNITIIALITISKRNGHSSLGHLRRPSASATNNREHHANLRQARRAASALARRQLERR